MVPTKPDSHPVHPFAASRASCLKKSHFQRVHKGDEPIELNWGCYCILMSTSQVFQDLKVKHSMFTSWDFAVQLERSSSIYVVSYKVLHTLENSAVTENPAMNTDKNVINFFCQLLQHYCTISINAALVSYNKNLQFSSLWILQNPGSENSWCSLYWSHMNQHIAYSQLHQWQQEHWIYPIQWVCLGGGTNLRWRRIWLRTYSPWQLHTAW